MAGLSDQVCTDDLQLIKNFDPHARAGARLEALDVDETIYAWIKAAYGTDHKLRR